MESEQKENQEIAKQEDIEKCIAVLNLLINDTSQLFDLPEEQRVALMTAAGFLSRPNKEEFTKRRKDAKKAAKRKMIERDKHARKETGIRSARESTIFIAPDFIEGSATNKQLESPRNCYVCKALYTDLHHFYDTMCTDC